MHNEHIIICSIFALLLLTATYFTISDIIRIVKQLRAFHRTTSEVGIFSGDTHSPGEIAKSVKTKLNGIEKTGRADHYVVQRLIFAIEAVLPPDNKDHTHERDSAEKGARTQLPSVDEWYMREVGEENTRRSVCVSRTLIASLLIMGIVGTLICLHVGYLADIRKLREALQPSLWAIGGTIILLVLRGIYRVVFERLESHINRYTLEVILPCFQLSTDTEDLEEDMTQSVDLLNECIKRIASSFHQCINPFFVDVEKYRHCLGKLLNVFDSGYNAVADATESMEKTTAKSKEQMQQVRDAYQRMLPTLTQMDNHLATIPNELQRLLSLLHEHRDRITVLSPELPSYPHNALGQIAPEIKRVLDVLRKLYSHAQPRFYVMRDHDQPRLSDNIRDEIGALEGTKAALSGVVSLMSDSIQNIRALTACLQNIKQVYTDTTNAQIMCMKEILNKLQNIKNQLDERKEQVDRLCAGLHRRYLAYRKRPWLFLNRWDWICPIMLLVLFVLKRYFFES